MTVGSLMLASQAKPSQAKQTCSNGTTSICLGAGLFPRQDLRNGSARPSVFPVGEARFLIFPIRLVNNIAEKDGGFHSDDIAMIHLFGRNLIISEGERNAGANAPPATLPPRPFLHACTELPYILVCRARIITSRRHGAHWVWLNGTLATSEI